MAIKVYEGCILGVYWVYTGYNMLGLRTFIRGNRLRRSSKGIALGMMIGQTSCNVPTSPLHPLLRRRKKVCINLY
jgi:hypothetical protein